MENFINFQEIVLVQCNIMHSLKECLKRIFNIKVKCLKLYSVF